jgi:amino acid adenylation domain-containing protein
MVYLTQQLLTESASRHPERSAVRFQERSLTYAELEDLTNRLAALLADAGVRPGDRVGIYLHKALESVVSVFGIQKAGAAYVPLDPGSPPRRVAYILRNCGVRCVVTSEALLRGLAGAFADGGGPPVAVVTDARAEGESPLHPRGRLLPWTALGAFGGASPAALPSVDSDLAYVLYTSGSTGDPKGVMLSHRHALTFIDWACETFRMGPEDRLSNHAPLHFDLSILDIFGAVKAGATVSLVPEGLSTFPLRLAEWIERERITLWYSVPSALTLLLLRGQLERFAFEPLRTVLFAGEVFPVKYLRALMQALPRAEFYNLYGPTETNVCTFYRVPPLAADRVKPIPIGRACANADVFALNDRGLPIGPGEEGELYVRGPLVTRGYWGDPARTARAVVRNPLQPHFDETVYRTGDIVTLEASGDYALVGRRDHLVKSRGYRIELGEVETALYGHPRVREAAVVAVADDVIGARLRALVAVDDPGAVTAEDIRRHCAALVPHYMVPESVEFREALPKTSTGKIDRALLSRELTVADPVKA